MDNISRVFDILILIIGVFVMTTLINASQEDRILEEDITVIVTQFTDNVRKEGKINQKMYNTFTDRLNTLGMRFDVHMVYTKDVVSPSGANGAENTVAVTQECYYEDDIRAGIFNSAEDGGAIIDGVADGEVHFNQGDSLYVEVKNHSKTLREQYYSLIPGLNSGSYGITARAGGLIRDEDWSD